MEQELKVVESFKSIEGEGLRAGELASFIRLYGCNLNCIYCDSKYAYNDDNYVVMSIYQILSTLKEYGCKNITVTGGEPLIHQNIVPLLTALTKNGYFVNVETNGSINLKDFPKFKNLFYTCDYKCGYSGMQKKMYTDNLYYLRNDDVLKFVVANEADLKEAHEVLKKHKPKCYVYFSPVFGEIEPCEIVEFMKKNNLQDKIRIQVQLHKIIYPKIERGV